MNLAVQRCFRKADRVTDRFHVQRLACDAVQESRIKYRWEALDEENEAIRTAKARGGTFTPGPAGKWRYAKTAAGQKPVFVVQA